MGSPGAHFGSKLGSTKGLNKSSNHMPYFRTTRRFAPDGRLGHDRIGPCGVAMGHDRIGPCGHI